MKNTPKQAEDPQFLSGWKEISNYLGKGIRTVQRYERSAGLPVRRPAGKSAGSVVATKAEVDAWIAARPIRDAFELKREASDHWHETRTGIKRGVAQMVLLRAQMTALRAELHTSLELLRQSLHSLQGELNQQRWRAQDDEAIAMHDAKQRKSYIHQMLEMGTKLKTN